MCLFEAVLWVEACGEVGAVMGKKSGRHDLCWLANASGISVDFELGGPLLSLLNVSVMTAE